MSSYFVGEIRIFAGNFAPVGWNFCDGTVLQAADYNDLFTLIGNIYGGDGQSTFAVPDLRGRVPLHQGNGFTLAQNGGVESVTLTAAQMPQHSHQVIADDNPANASSGVPTNNIYASQSSTLLYSVPGAPGNDPPALVGMNTTMLAAAGGSQPHDNFQPYLCLNFIISLFGDIPHQ